MLKFTPGLVILPLSDWTASPPQPPMEPRAGVYPFPPSSRRGDQPTGGGLSALAAAKEVSSAGYTACSVSSSFGMMDNFRREPTGGRIGSETVAGLEGR